MFKVNKEASIKNTPIQSALNCSKSTVETLEDILKYAQS